MAKPKDSKFNKKYSFVDNLPKDGPKFHDFQEGKEWRTCEECKGVKQENSEHLRFFKGKFRCKECRKEVSQNDSSDRAGRV